MAILRLFWRKREVKPPGLKLEKPVSKSELPISQTWEPGCTPQMGLPEVKCRQ